jgi:hypothetical protein
MDTAVARPVSHNFGSPKFGLALGPFEQAAFMTMPKAAIDKNDRTILGKHEIWPPRQVSRVEAKSESELMQTLAKGHLALCVLGANSGHHPASRSWVYNIRH